jgi:NADP-dependent 3-hydroxy acid dehydrogenase YdfG
LSKTLLVCGHGPGISASMARLYGARGYAVALVARSAERVEAAAAALRAKGIRAAAFAADMADPAAMAHVVSQASRELGTVTVVHWNGYAAVAGDLVTAPVAEVRRVLDTAVTGLLATLRASPRPHCSSPVVASRSTIRRSTPLPWAGMPWVSP